MIGMNVPVGFLQELKERTNAIRLLKLVSDEWSDEEEDVPSEEVDVTSEIVPAKDIQEIVKYMKTTSRKEKKKKWWFIPRFRFTDKKKKESKSKKSRHKSKGDSDDLPDSLDEVNDNNFKKCHSAESLISKGKFDVESNKFSHSENSLPDFSNPISPRGHKRTGSDVDLRTMSEPLDIKTTSMSLRSTSSEKNIEKKDERAKMIKKAHKNNKPLTSNYDLNVTIDSSSKDKKKKLKSNKSEEIIGMTKSKSKIKVFENDIEEPVGMVKSKSKIKIKDDKKKKQSRKSSKTNVLEDKFDLDAMVEGLNFGEPVPTAPVPEKDPEKPKDEIGPTIEIIRKLGKGGNATVWLGNLDGKKVALKQIDLNKLPTKKISIMRKQLKREVDLVMSLENEHIVKYLGLFYNKVEKEVNVVMELVEGIPITDLVVAYSKLDEAIVSYLTKQILLGMKYLHKSDIIHRDLKPDNLLIDQNALVKIIDFGTASLDSGEYERRSTVGTPWYCAPEVINTEEYNCSVDIWSLGCLIIELVSGKPPYDDQNSIQCLMKMASEVPPIPKDISDECYDFIDLCLNPRKELRPSADILLQHEFLHQSSASTGKVIRSLEKSIAEIMESSKNIED